MSYKEATAEGMFWTISEKLLSQLVQFVFSIIIARQLQPSDYGVVGLLGIFFGISSVFIDSGFSNAIMRKTDRTEEDLSTIFFFNLFISVFFYFLLFVFAGSIADFFHIPELVPIVRVLGLTLILNAISIIQITQVKLKFDFKLIFKINVVTAVITSILGLVMAYSGYGVWTLVMQNFASPLLIACFFWFLGKWRPRGVFKTDTIRELTPFSIKLLISGLVDTLFLNINKLIIGKVNTTKDLGLYSRAESFSNVPFTVVNGALLKVTYPVFVNMQEDDERLFGGIKKSVNIVSYLLFFVLGFLFLEARPIVLILLTDKWIEAVPYVRVLSASFMFLPIYQQYQTAMQIKGRSDIFLKTNLISKVIAIILIYLFSFWGPLYIAVSMIISAIVTLIITLMVVKIIFKISINSQVFDIFRLLLIVCISVLMTILVMNFLTNNVAEIIIGGLFFSLCYFVLTLFFAKKEFLEIKDIFQQLITTKKG